MEINSNGRSLGAGKDGNPWLSWSISWLGRWILGTQGTSITKKERERDLYYIYNYIHVKLYIYIYICNYIILYTYIYILQKRERERDRESLNGHTVLSKKGVYPKWCLTREHYDQPVDLGVPHLPFLFFLNKLTILLKGKIQGMFPLRFESDWYILMLYCITYIPMNLKLFALPRSFRYQWAWDLFFRPFPCSQYPGHPHRCSCIVSKAQEARREHEGSRAKTASYWSPSQQFGGPKIALSWLSSLD